MRKQNSAIIGTASQVEENATMERSRFNYLQVKNDDEYYTKKRK